jgi:hypothetical protein
LTKFDSKSEATASHTFASLSCLPAKGTLPQTFKDADGIEFHAKADFIHTPTGVLIEYKNAPLNNKKTKRTSDNALESKLKFRGFLSLWDYICHGWNHSKNKQAIVQKALTPQNFIVVFDKPPALAEAYTYQQAGIVFIPMSALSKYLSYVRLVKAGLAATFSLSYDTELGPWTVAIS